MDRIDAKTLAGLLGGWAADGPLYRALAAALRSAIEADSLPPGARLPSERDLAAALVVSRSTVVAAYDELRAGGLVDSRRGSGTVVAALPALRRPGADGRVPGGTATSIIQSLVDERADLITLNSAGAPASEWLADAVAAVAREDLPALTADAGYQPRGLPALRSALADCYTSDGLPTVPEQIVVTTGATQAISLVAQVFLRRGSTVVVETPSWPGCLDAFRAAGADPIGVPLDDEGARIDAFAAAMSRSPSLAFLMPTFHNPTGMLMSPARRRRIASLAAEHGVPIMEDNSYDTLFGGRPAPIAAEPDVEAITVGSLAKTVWPGLRLGWLRAPVEVAERVARHKALVDLGSPLLDQAVALRLLPRLPAITEEHTTALHARHDQLAGLLADRLPSWRWRPPDGGTSLWVELPGVDAAAFAQLARRHGVEIVPGAAMDPDGTHDSYIRLPFTYPPPILDELVDRLATAWKALRPNNSRHSTRD
ncbi:DNA-binding transcriptional MocR family regulator [Herbihabitans rhizosphaerae]|uniref:DNA-binding transcriptional MocR family regulator n=1 Tax=Herbihabitans rhizosphaerae TaxID=1872711 RepID=A0A4Q7KVD2_9PSEU|nr:PLP-dependent aminotransferase family protein [Herbihabitans rhizosphaerae]RZS40969.1 DNA-binding transcriptional MocR family regulator [Herbihabitans rhizosphaerae]